jgi:hypothetical protein
MVIKLPPVEKRSAHGNGLAVTEITAGVSIGITEANEARARLGFDRQ